MDWFPLFNSLRIAAFATVIVVGLGLFLAEKVTACSRGIKGLCDVIITMPLVLPPTVIGFFILKVVGPKALIGRGIYALFHTNVTMTWVAGVIATAVVALPLMYRTTRGAFESYNLDYTYAAQTLGLSDTAIFWRVKLPTCKKGIIAGSILAFARALGEYGATSMVAGYMPGKTATISTAVYQLWRTGNDEAAMVWVVVNLLISAVVLTAINFFEERSHGEAHLH
ncbi:molybdate ABC transporter permease subunit [Peptoniphilus equinus]|uniref:Molybdenum transport system permease n=1 Tax=Peptoniphilus equinus TaxID=3016343 RepID=A0ABY7QVJ1_9FIRM|nr:molybdate ABC transporter permease subunit [Peptoniphilus equinus]WBW50065.1 molybdate ABC transporter permease subunit [Peptoniphilus equinus]